MERQTDRTDRLLVKGNFIVRLIPALNRVRKLAEAML